MARCRPATSLLLCSFLCLTVRAATAQEEAAKPLRAGIIGLDTSHVVAFTKLLNGPKSLGVRVVAAYPGGSADIPSSRDRVEEYTKELRDGFKVEIVDSIPELLKKVDVVLLESVDGRPHLEQIRPVFEARKPVFIDKPVAGSLADAVKIFELARESGTPCFSSSSLRYSPGVVAIKNDPKIGEIRGCDAFSPCSLEEHHPDLFWYGVHGVETLFTLMGTGCKSVTRVQSDDSEFVTGTWDGGRIGTFRGLRGHGGYGAMVFGTKGSGPCVGTGAYDLLLQEVCTFFKTGKPPVSADETLEIFAFMEAADESKRQGGKPVLLETVLAKARAEAAK
ncbi:Gfo/Idh/MocA family protein [Singulisphaera acidiphila]|uniref:Putative dehydrogenase n=1 Tax=Singulisphaera acidiphila (strain ATCC BAA-1392 / DSM 18658 / VKM B-2454 / MOB10) TaxID=886293 RepID=L0DBW4_SINAD|nr:putative dehydrogenase [Singulisphaera acidiphila DSM 18658]